MFDAIRQHNKIMMWILFLLVFPSFVFFGIEGYGRFNEGASKVAEVGGSAITQTDWDNAHRQDVDQARTANPNVDLNLLDSPAMKYASLERLVRDRVLALAAQQEHLLVSDARLAGALQADPSIAALRDAEGRLDMEGYKRLLATQGLTPEGFEERLRANLSVQQVLGGIADSDIVAQAQVDATMGAFLERREVQVVPFTPAAHVADLKPSAQELQAYYQAHLAQYEEPESARVEYIVLDLDSVKNSITVSDAELKTYYEQNAATLGTPEERRASHILIVAPRDEPPAEREKARATAEQLLQQVRADPARFAEVARKSSQDEISAASGGDLGFFQLARGTDPAIAQATFKLAKVGDISDLVESDFGYHIIELTAIKPAQVPPFDELRARLSDQLRTQQAQARFSEMAEAFTNGVYEQSDSLKPVAEQLHLTIHTAEVTRTPAPGASGALASAKFLNALFSGDVVNNKMNTEATEVGANQLAAGRVLEHTAAHARPFEQVEDEVRDAWLQERGAQAARAAGEARLKAWQADPASATDLPATITISRDDPRQQPQAVVEAVLRVDPDKLPAFVGVDLGAQGYAIARVDKVLPPALRAPAESAQLRASYAQLWNSTEVRSYYDLLKARYKAKILVPRPAPGELAPATE
ncbi:MAG TPA: SurA N-terminal domain-containing protein [Ottowia sp.]|uniref:SurA N-terminal domain-containing protein n=1 Tax=Ottowia sp. TaxID=1898956 RepID=UPI002CD03271|nr:SurA N-terminal domain-containing protein [Ottowia sp.]HMN21057.1 SurA N-terminal domain-containing protein [Ottowia sp.]